MVTGASARGNLGLAAAGTVGRADGDSPPARRELDARPPAGEGIGSGRRIAGGGTPVAFVDAHLDRFDAAASTPGDAADVERPGGDLRALGRRRDERVDGELRQTIVAEPVVERLERPVVLAFDQLDPDEPLDRVGRVPARHDRSERGAVSCG